MGWVADLQAVSEFGWRYFGLTQNPASVPALTSLCIGTTHPLEPRRMTTWLPDWRTLMKPIRSSALMIAAPEMRGSLGMCREAEHSYNGMAGGKYWKF